MESIKYVILDSNEIETIEKYNDIITAREGKMRLLSEYFLKNKSYIPNFKIYELKEVN